MAVWVEVPRSVRRAFRWDATAALLTGLYLGGVYPFLGVIARRDLQASAFLIACLSASWSVGNLFAPLTAYYIRGRPKLPYAVGPGLAARSLFFAMPLAVGAPAFIGISFLASAVGSLGAPAYAAVIRDAYPVERRGRLMGLVRVVQIAASMAAAAVVGSVLVRVSYRWVFPALAALGVLGTLAFSRIGVRAEPQEPPPPRTPPWESFHLLAADRAFRLYAACFFLYGLGNLVMGPVIPIFQVDELRISTPWVGYLATCASAFGMVGYLLWGRVLDRQGPSRMMLSVVAVAAVAPTVCFFAHSVPPLLLAAAAQGLAAAGGDLGYVNAAMHFGRRDAVAAYAGMFAFLQACRGIPGPFLGAALAGALGPRAVFLIALGLWATSAGLMLTRGPGARAQAHP